MKTETAFEGSDYKAEFDFKRLTGQIRRIFITMKDGQWRTLGEISATTGDGESSISAQLRNMRKERYGTHSILKRRRGEPSNGLFEYKLEPSYKQQKLI